MRKHLGGRYRQQGMTLLELMIGVTIVALVMALAMPTFNEIVERKKLEGAAEKLYADLQSAKTEAIKRNVPVFVNFNTVNQCYGMALTTGCACNTAGSCALDSGVDTAVKMSDFGGTTTMSETFTGTEIVFNPRRGTVSRDVAGTLNVDGPVTFTSPRGKIARIVLENAFRIKICSPAGAGKDFTYEDC